MTSTDPFDPDAFRNFEHAGWQTAGERYIRHFVAVTDQAVEPILDAAVVSQGTRVLDVATGPGNVAAAAAARGAEVTGVDFSAAQVALARRLNPGIDFQEGDAEDLPFGDGGFDAVVMNFGMLHFPHPERAIAEAFRVLAPGGRFSFTVWAPPGDSPPFAILGDSVAAHGTLELDMPQGTPMFRFAKAEECARVLGEAGFSSAETTLVPLTLRLDSPDGLFTFYAEGAVRAAATINNQTETAQAAIREAMRGRVSEFARDGGYELPMPCMLSAAAKP